MTIKNIVSKELESAIDKMTSQFQSDLNNQLTKLISNTLVESEIENSSDKVDDAKQEAKIPAASIKEIADLKLALEDEKNANIEQKQKFQVEITQLKINHAESIEALEYGLEDLQAELLNSKDDNSKELMQNVDKLTNQLSAANKSIFEKDKLLNDLKVSEKKVKEQLSTEREKAAIALDTQKKSLRNSEDSEKLAVQKISTQLNDARSALSEKDKHLNTLKTSEKQAVEKLKLAQLQQKNTLKALEDTNKRLSALEVNTNVLEQQTSEITQLKVKLTEAEAQAKQARENESKLVAEALKAAEKKYAELIEKLQQEQSANEESKLKEISQQQLIELQQKQLKDHLSLEETLKSKVAELTTVTEKSEANFAEKQQEINALHESNTLALSEKLQVLEKDHEAVLKRFSLAKEKQEQENTLVRDTIKNLRHENNELKAKKSSESDELAEQVNLLEQKMTEYRLKFEYAQKQITQMAT